MPEGQPVVKDISMDLQIKEAQAQLDDLKKNGKDSAESLKARGAPARSKPERKRLRPRGGAACAAWTCTPSAGDELCMHSHARTAPRSHFAPPHDLCVHRRPCSA